MDPLVLAQSAYDNPSQPIKDAIGYIEAGQGLRARADTMQQNRVLAERQNQEFQRQQDIRRLFASGNEDEAKKLMTLQERGQLADLQSKTLALKTQELQFDQQDQAFKDTLGLRSRLTELDPKSPDYEANKADLLSTGAPVLATNKAYGDMATTILQAKDQANTIYKQNTPGTLEFYKKQTATSLLKAEGLDAQDRIAWTEKGNAALTDLYKLKSLNVSPQDMLTKIDQWDVANAEAMHGPVGENLQKAKDQVIKDLIRRGKLNGTQMEAFKPGEQVIDPASGRLVIWATSPSDRIDVATGLPLYIQSWDPEGRFITGYIKNDKVWGSSKPLEPAKVPADISW